MGLGRDFVHPTAQAAIALRNEGSTQDHFVQPTIRTYAKSSYYTLKVIISSIFWNPLNHEEFIHDIDEEASDLEIDLSIFLVLS